MGNLIKPTSQNAVKIRQAWELFVSGDDGKFLDIVRPEIRDSWRRSRQAGVNPSTQRMPTTLDQERLEHRCKQNTHFLEAGREVIALFSQLFTAREFIASLVDKEGNLLYSYFPPHGYDRRLETNVLPGAGVQENLVGTTPSGLALSLGKACRVNWYEFYVEFGHCWAGCSAPIHHFCGGILGALFIAGYGEVPHRRAIDQVTFAASSIEDRIKRFEQGDHLESVEEFNRYLLRFPESPLLALCPHGRILALSPAMAKLMTLQSPERLIGQRLHDRRDFQLEGLFPPTSDDSPEPYESFLLFPQKEKSFPSTVTPIFKKGRRVGLVVIASGLNQPTQRKVIRPQWQAPYTFSDLVGHSPAFSYTLQLAKKAAEHDWPVLLVGESGTGKELFAQAIHRASRRASEPFLAINCSTIPKELAASELFGYEEGAFSGALRGGQPGKIALAHRGTLFLDEIMDMPAEIQAGLLRVLEEGKVMPLGSRQPQDVNVRVIAALNADPAAAVRQGKLRLDLYHRLNVFPIALPPLQGRVEDLPVLVRHLLDREGFANTEVAPEVFEVFRTYSWPGNVRELRNVLVRAAILASDQVITPEHLPPEILVQKPLPSGKAQERWLDQERLQQALKKSQGNIVDAAKLLGIHRSTFYRKLCRYGLARKSLIEEAIDCGGQRGQIPRDMGRPLKDTETRG